jgi:hypothetical protein
LAANRHGSASAEQRFLVTAIFVNYRINEDPGTAIWIASELAACFGADQVFRDSASISPGDNFERVILRAVRQADVVLAIIGPRWAEVPGPAGGRALDNAQDWVRRELTEALANRITVIPILVHGAPPLAAMGLPAELGWLAQCQYIRVDHHSAQHDMAGLTDGLRRQFPRLTSRTPQPALPMRPDGSSREVVHAPVQRSPAANVTSFQNHGRDVKINNKRFHIGSIRFGFGGLAVALAVIFGGIGGTAAVVANHFTKSVALSSAVGTWRQDKGSSAFMWQVSPAVLTVSPAGRFTFAQHIAAAFPGTGTPPPGFDASMNTDLDCSGTVAATGDHFTFYSTSGLCNNFEATLEQADTIMNIGGLASGGMALAKSHP